MNDMKSVFKSNLMDELLDEITPLEMEKVKVKMLLSARIEELIKQKGFSKSKFAEEVNKNNSVITRWLSGTQNLTTDALVEIAFALNLGIKELFTFSETRVIYCAQIQIFVRPLSQTRIENTMENNPTTFQYQTRIIRG